MCIHYQLCLLCGVAFVHPEKKDFFTEKSETTDQPSAPMILFKSVGRDLCVKFSYLQFIIKFKFVYELHVPVKSVCFSHVGVKCSDTRSAHTGECRSAIWLKPKSWLIDMRRRWAFEQGAPYAVIIHRAALLANSLLLPSLLDSHMLFSPEIAGNIRRPDYQKAHYFYCSFIPQMLWDGREETDAASSFPTKLTKFSQFHHLCLQKETSRLSIFSHLDFRGMAGNAPPGYLPIWTGRLTGPAERSCCSTSSAS